MNLLSLKYWFNPNPGPWLPGALRVVDAFFILLFLVGLLASLFKLKQTNVLMVKFWSKVQGLGLTVGFVGAMLVFARQQGLSGLAMPFLLLLVVVGGAVWAGHIFKYITKTVPQRRREQEEKKEKEKYLPGRNK